jgi:hypothetical protein
MARADAQARIPASVTTDIQQIVPDSMRRISWIPTAHKSPTSHGEGADDTAYVGRELGPTGIADRLIGIIGIIVSLAHRLEQDERHDDSFVWLTSQATLVLQR